MHARLLVRLLKSIKDKNKGQKKIHYLLSGSRRERHAFVTPSHTYAGRDDKLTRGVKVTEAVDLGIGAKAGLWVFHTVTGVTGVVVLDDQVKQLLVARVRVGGRITGVDTHLAALMKSSCMKKHTAKNQRLSVVLDTA